MNRDALDISTASTASVSLGGKFILRDTMGPTQAAAEMTRNESENSVSTTSSIKELSAADERGLNRSFRAIQMAKYSTDGPRSSGETLVEEDAHDCGDEEGKPVDTFDIDVVAVTGPKDTYQWNDTGLKTEPIKIIEGSEGRGTPDSTASSHSGNRVIFGKGGTKTRFAPGAIQDNHANKPNALDKTTRGYLRREERGEQNNPPISYRHMNGLSEDTNPKEVNMSFSAPPEKRNDSSCFSPKCAMKLTLLLIMIAVLVAGTALLIHFFKDKSQKGSSPQVVPDEEEPEMVQECPTVKIKFKELIVFRCDFGEDTRDLLEDVSSLVIKPPLYYNNGENKTINLEGSYKEQGNWQVTMPKDNSYLLVTGPSAACSSSGNYTLHFRDRRYFPLYTVGLTIVVKSEVSKVNVTLSQEEGTNNQFKIGCSTNSGCQQSSVDFFAEINQEETTIEGVNFSCLIHYTDYNGFNVACEGIIPDFLLEKITRITCRPSSKLLEDIDDEEIREKKIKELEEEVALPDCNITMNCGYKCEGLSSHYYIVDSGRCDIFHRCYKNDVYTSFCPPGTFFNPEKCTCDHSKTINWCREDGLNKDKNSTWCDATKSTE